MMPQERAEKCWRDIRAFLLTPERSAQLSASETGSIIEGMMTEEIYLAVRVSQEEARKLAEALEESLTAYKVACRLEDNWQSGSGEQMHPLDPRILRACSTLAAYRAAHPIGGKDGK